MRVLNFKFNMSRPVIFFFSICWTIFKVNCFINSSKLSSSVGGIRKHLIAYQTWTKYCGTSRSWDPWGSSKIIFIFWCLDKANLNHSTIYLVNGSSTSPGDICTRRHNESVIFSDISVNKRGFSFSISIKLGSNPSNRNLLKINENIDPNCNILLE